MGILFTKGERCPVSDPANPHTLSEGVDDDPSFCCHKCGEDGPGYGPHYICVTCNVGFHETCYKRPRNITHPYHPQHPLTLVTEETAIIKSDFVFNKCDWCEGELGRDRHGDPSGMFYRCSICGFCLDFSCAEESSPPPTITSPASHHHPLVFFPRPYLSPCDACGLVNKSEPVFTCYQCNYMVHQSCISLPRIIKITRHPHRLSYNPYFVPENSTCQICYKRVDIKYGQFSCCYDGECSYVAHSKCATHEYVWDGHELEWEPEETNETEDLEPFEKVGLDVIKHFFHEHHLRIQKYDMYRDADKQCQACVSPIHSRDFYNCVECNFFLHEVCANLPRKLDHALHRHPLVLETSPPEDHSNMYCSRCKRQFNGFRYICQCSSYTIQVDIQCILVPDYLTHKSHDHPLFISTCNTSNRGVGVYCTHCNSYECSVLQCTLCEFRLCYRCATIPHEVYYKNDEHRLSLCYGEEVDNTYWCETCEKIIDPEEWFYTCKKCCITIHCDCILGTSVYMKPGHTFKYFSTDVEVVRNSGSTRPICCGCNKRCPESVYYKMPRGTICSTNCWKAGR